MTYAETVEYLFNRLPMFSRIGADAFKKDLTNTIRLCEAIGNPHQKFKSIHIAGTNGKGSTSHMLAAVLQSAGYKTGLYTSPHLKDFRERIKINGDWCEQQFIVDFTQRIMPLIEEIEPSFFEITVAMAFDYFAKQEVDIAVIEVGLGGRLDSTNIITPELSVITNIGMDHMYLLGDTLQLIAFEKAGIIKKDIPVVIGEALPETKPVFVQKASDVDAPIIFAEEKKYVAGWKHEHHVLVAEIADSAHDTHSNYTLDLTGIYQLKNLVTVLEAIHQLQLKDWRIKHDDILQGLAHVKKLTGLHGRWEIVHHNPTVVLDVGHNVDGIKQIVRQLELSDYRHLHIIIGMVKDKEIDSVLSLLPKNAHYYFTQAQIPRALDSENLMQKAKHFELNGSVSPEVNMALKHVLTHAHVDDLILVCGSVFLVGEVI